MIIKPHAGQQWSFCATRAQMFIGGGSAGGGKSRAMLLRQMRYANVPAYTGAVIRRSYPELTGPGSIWEDSRNLFPHLGGKSNASALTWRFPKGGLIKFAHMGQNIDETERAHRSKEYSEISVDECVQITGRQWWELFSRNRNPKCTIRPCMGGTTNPDPDWDLAHMLDWWIDSDGYPIRERSGILRWFLRRDEDDSFAWGDTPEECIKVAKLPKSSHAKPISFTFIPFGVDDNPTLMAMDDSYASKLANLNRVQRMRLLGGNWKVRATAGTYFDRQYAQMVDRAPENVTRWVRAWDRASSPPTPENPDPDWTVGVLMGITSDKKVVIDHVLQFRDTPAGNERRIRQCAEEDPKLVGMPVRVILPQDPGAAGKDSVDHYKRNVLQGKSVDSIKITRDKELMASPLSARWERGDVLVTRGPWNNKYLNELESFPEGGHDDAVDASSLGYMELGKKSATEILKALNRY